MDDRKMLWSGRFAAGPHPEMLRLTSSTASDFELLPQDLRATRAHARVLVAAGLLAERSAAAVDDACEAIREEVASGELHPSPTDEDVHSFVERELTERLGETGARIHAGRSRNDLVAADLRLWCRDAAIELVELTCALEDALVGRAAEHVDTVMPGYTHLQRAQPVTLAFHLLAHGFSFIRDAGRFRSAAESASTSVLGAGALGGTTLPLDPRVAARELSCERVFDNAMDAVSDRDFICDLLYACGLSAVHLSRLGEEIVLWTSSEFGFARLRDEWSTGSSMMPQKRNPDLAELLRGRSAGAIGDLTAMLTLLKGLPLAYDRDLQEDKEHLFRGVARMRDALTAARYLIENLVFDRAVLAAATSSGVAWATDLAERLVLRGVPFREAHAATGALVASLERDGLALSEVEGAYLKGHHERFEATDREVSDPRSSVASRSSHGSAGRESVMRQLGKLTQAVSDLRRAVPSLAGAEPSRA